MNERITEAELREMEDDIAAQGVTNGARLIAEVRRLRALILAVDDAADWYTPGPNAEWEALAAEASAIRGEQEG